MAREEDGFVWDLGTNIERYCGPGFVLINVGAEDGYEAGRIAERFPAATVYAVEASPVWPPSKVARSMMGIIGEFTGVTTFYINMDDTGLSSSRERPGRYRHIEAMQWRLDDFVASRSLKSPTALLIDTEGTTGEVLDGCGALLAGVNFICAEVQKERASWGGTTGKEVDSRLAPHGLRRVPGGYRSGEQANFYWARTACT